MQKGLFYDAKGASLPCKRGLLASEDVPFRKKNEPPAPEKGRRLVWNEIFICNSFLLPCRIFAAPFYRAQAMLPPIGCIVIFSRPSLPTFCFFTADFGQRLLRSAVS